MVTILPPREKAPSFSQKLSAGIGTGLQMGTQMFQEHQQKQAQAEQAEKISQLIGMDVSGFDPEMQKIALQLSLQGKNQQVTELLKQQGKEGILQKKQDFLNKIFGGNQNQVPQDQNFSQQIQQQNPNQQSGFNPLTISDADIALATSLDPALGRELRAAKDTALRERRDREKIQLEEKKITRHEQFEREKLGRHEETEISKPVLIELNQMRKNIPLQEQAIIDIQEASPNVSGRDYFADVTGFEPLRTAEGAKLKTGIKDFFLSDLTRVGARPNQWIEQQLADALPKIGRSAEANLITAEGLKFKLDLAKKRIELIDKLAEQDRQKFGFVKGDIDSRAYNDMKKYVIDRQKQLQDSIKKIKAQAKGKKNVVQMSSPDGSIYEILSDDIDEAIENGFNFTK